MCRLPYDLGSLTRMGEKIFIKVAWSRSSLFRQTAHYLDNHQVWRSLMVITWQVIHDRTELMNLSYDCELSQGWLCVRVVYSFSCLQVGRIYHDCYLF
jgi:hypothetical protein